MKDYFLYFLVLVSVICAVSTIAKGELTYLDEAKFFSNLLNVSAAAGDGIKSIPLKPTHDTELDVAKQIVESVSSALGSYGVILTATFGLLTLLKDKEPTDREVILHQFEQVHLRFDAIHNELVEITHLIGEIPEKVELHARIAQVEILILAFQRLVHSPLTETDDFRKRCDNSPPDATLDYIYSHRGAIIAGVARRYDRLTLLQTMQALGFIQISALNMYEACLGVKFVDLPEGQQEQYRNGKKLTVEGFKKNIPGTLSINCTLCLQQNITGVSLR